jgi:hypothetical protein
MSKSPTWKDTLRGAVLYDETGRIIGELTVMELGNSAGRTVAVHRGEQIGEYISREHARHAIEAAERNRKE